MLSTYPRGSCQISRDSPRGFSILSQQQTSHIIRCRISFGMAWDTFLDHISIIQRKNNVSGMKYITKSWICGGFVPALTALRRRISPLKTMDLCSKTLFLIPETTINTFLMKYAFELCHTSHILNHISLCLESDKCHVEFHVDLANLSHHFKVLIDAVQHVKFLRI